MNEIITKQKLLNILSSRFKGDEKKLSQIPNPALLHDGIKAAKRVAKAIKNREKITLIGDYDVDGVSSSAIVVLFFKEINYPLEAIIPNRFKDGYGVSENILTKIDTDVIITVDNGIAALEAAKICKQRGIDLIITDHHTPPDTLPDAYAIVDPKLKECKYPFKEICGTEVAWLVLGLLKKELQVNIDMKQYLDILAIAIIADIMPLIDINRVIVKEGLKFLSYSKRASSIIIRDFLNKSTITSEDIAFNIAPRLNSAGRLSDASLALDFFIASNTYEAYELFEKLNELNEQRKEIEAITTSQAIDLVDENDNIIVVAKDGWHEGVVGIVASRLVDKFSKPAIVLSIDNEVAKGSARSLGDIDIYELIKQNSSFLTKFGGHKMAAGLGLESKNIEAFKKAINLSAKNIDSKDFIVKEDITGILPIEEIDFELLEILERFEPYGEANPRPKFLLQEAKVVSIKLIGRDKTHSKIEVKESLVHKDSIELIAFRKVFEMPEDKIINCSFKVSKNEFNGRVSLQLLVDKIY